MEDKFDENGIRTYFTTELLIDSRDDKEYVYIKAKKEGFPFVTRRRILAAVADNETLEIIGTDMHQQLGLAQDASENGTLAPLGEIEEDEDE